jgi:hypothetical protein
MRLQLQSDSHISLFRLFPVFPLTLVVTNGRSLIRRRGFERSLLSGQRIVLEPFEFFELHLDGSAFQPSLCTLEIQGDRTPSADSPFWHQLSHKVFLNPERMWNAELAALALRTTPSGVRRTLFAEGAALTHICRTQRLMRGLFDLLQGATAVQALAHRLGWTRDRDLDSSFYDWFGLSLWSVPHLAADRWSAASGPGCARAHRCSS